MSAWAVNKPIFLNPNCLCEIYMNDAMSALSQKQTCAVQKGMSAVPPKATSNATYGMSAKGHKRTSEHLTGLVALLRSSENLPCEQEVVERLGSWCHTLKLRAKNIGVGGQHFDIVCFVDALDDSRRHHLSVGRRNDA